MAAENTFSPSGEHAIHQKIDVVPTSIGAGSNAGSEESIEVGYEIEQTADLIIEHNSKSIALQFPDELLHESVPVYQGLKARLPDRELWILADTSYGSCCVDEVASQHASADVVVHYGHTCLSRSSRLPVIYVFPKRPIDIKACVDAFSTAFQPLREANALELEKVFLFNDVAYTHQMQILWDALKSALPNSTVHHVPITKKMMQPLSKDSTPEPDDPDSLTTRRNTIPSSFDRSRCSIIYVGSESLALNNVLLTHGTVPVYSYDPEEREVKLGSARSNKLLMRRYAVMQRARDADVFGILVGTLGVALYAPLIAHLRELIGSAQPKRKFYTISVGKLNPAKLANFPEIECYVMVACPENSIVESKEFAVPIVTPYELELALRKDVSWTGDVVLDFERILKIGDNATVGKGKEKEAGEDGDPDRPSFSLVTGQYRTRKYGVEANDNPKDTFIEDAQSSSAVIERDKNKSLTTRQGAGVIGDYLQTRFYQGLEPRLGMDQPSRLEQGRSGIASEYAEVDHPEHVDSESRKEDLNAAVPVSHSGSTENDNTGKKNYNSTERNGEGIT